MRRVLTSRFDIALQRRFLRIVFSQTVARHAGGGVGGGDGGDGVEDADCGLVTCRAH